MICPSVYPLDQAELIAVRTAAVSFVTPLVKNATRLARARSIQASSSVSAFVRTIAWNKAIVSRASTSKGTPPSIAATVNLTPVCRRPARQDNGCTFARSGD